MPVYNARNYIYESVDSILKQDFQEFELILVDDGSTDDSYKKCLELAQTDDRIKVFHKENGGTASARNYGLKKAKGEYITFCDQDDKYLPRLLSDNYKIAKENQADLVRFKRKKIRKSLDGKTESNVTHMPSGVSVFQGNDLDKNYLVIRKSGWTVWTGLYRREFLLENKISFNQKIRYIYEDHAFNLLVYKYCKCIVLNSKIYYLWIQRDGVSTSTTFHYNGIQALFYIIKKDYEVLKLHNCAEEEVWNDIVMSYLLYCYEYMNRSVKKLSILKKISILKKLRKLETIKENLTGNCDKHLISYTDKILQKAIRFFYKGNMIITYLLLKIYYANG